MQKDTKQQHKHTKQKLNIITSTTIKQTDTTKHTATWTTNLHKDHKKNRHEKGHETTTQTHKQKLQIENTTIKQTQQSTQGHQAQTHTKTTIKNNRHEEGHETAIQTHTTKTSHKNTPPHTKTTRKNREKQLTHINHHNQTDSNTAQNNTIHKHQHNTLPVRLKSVKTLNKNTNIKNNKYTSNFTQV